MANYQQTPVDGLYGLAGLDMVLAAAVEGIVHCLFVLSLVRWEF